MGVRLTLQAGEAPTLIWYTNISSLGLTNQTTAQCFWDGGTGTGDAVGYALNFSQYDFGYDYGKPINRRKIYKEPEYYGAAVCLWKVKMPTAWEDIPTSSSSLQTSECTEIKVFNNSEISFVGGECVLTFPTIILADETEFISLGMKNDKFGNNNNTKYPYYVYGKPSTLPNNPFIKFRALNLSGPTGD